MGTDENPRRYEGRENYPSKHVDGEAFLENEKVAEMLAQEENLCPEDGHSIFNCVHCNECGTSHERALLSARYVEEGNDYEGLEELKKNFRAHDTPYQTCEMKIKRPEGIPGKSDTLFFMGCLSTIKLPKFTENALQLLLSRGVDFTILDKEICCGYPVYAAGLHDEYERVKEANTEIFKRYKNVICLCPACYFLYVNDYPEMPGVKFTFVTDHLGPAKEQKSGSVSIQHMCQLENRGREEVSGHITEMLEQSGYEVKELPHWCCGGGKGYMYRTDVIDEIAMTRLKDFTGDYMTTACPGCYWIMKVYRGKAKASPRLKDLFSLLIE